MINVFARTHFSHHVLVTLSIAPSDLRLESGQQVGMSFDADIKETGAVLTPDIGVKTGLVLVLS